MKRRLLLASLAFVCAHGVSAQNYIYENFNTSTGGALPASWASTPASQWKTGEPDAVTPYNLGGVSGNTASHMKAAGINGNIGAAADGAILSTPAINLPASATGTKIAFSKCYFGFALNSDPSKKESFTLVASTNGGSTWSDVATINPGNGWKDTIISVGTYAGQSNLKLGFKYGNTASALVGASIDNVRIYIAGANDIALLSAAPEAGAPNSYKTVGGNVTITGSVFNYGTAVLNNYTVKYQQGSGPVASYNVTNANIASAASGNFSHGTPFTIPAVGTFPIKVWVELTGDTYHNDDSASAQAIGVSFMPVKKLVFEEGTGTWCGFCPRGSLYMEKFAELHPGKAAQIAVHNDDPMTVSAYDTYMGSYFGGYPSMTSDRLVNADPSDIEAVYTAMKDNFGYAEITMGTPAISGTTVTIPVTVKAATNITNPKLALVVTESNVSGTGSAWDQHNYYSDSRSQDAGTLGGGWDAQPDPVPGVKYHFVARSISPSVTGGASGLPATLVAGTIYNATLTATLNSAWKTADLQYIAMLMDGSATVLNSAFSPLPTLKPTLPSTSAVANIEAGIENAQLYPNPTTGVAYLQVELTDATNGTLTITDVMGRPVSPAKTTAMRSGTTVLEIQTEHLATGMYLINLATEKGNVAMKLQVINKLK